MKWLDAISIVEKTTQVSKTVDDYLSATRSEKEKQAILPLMSTIKQMSTDIQVAVDVTHTMWSRCWGRLNFRISPIKRLSRCGLVLPYTANT